LLLAVTGTLDKLLTAAVYKGIIESDDVASLSMEIEKSLNYCKKCNMLVESVKRKDTLVHLHASVILLPREATRSAVLPWQIVRPSVSPSVTLRYRDYIGWNSTKIISWLISLTISLSADPNMTDLLQSEHPQILTGIGVG